MRAQARLVVALAVLLVVGVGFALLREPSRVGAPGASPPEADAVRILVNGTEVARVAQDRLAERRPLASFLPPEARDPEAWRLLRARALGNGRFSVAEPAERFDDHVVLLYLAGAEWPSVGVFRRIDPSTSEAVRTQIDRPTVFLVRVREVEVWTVDPPETRPEPSATKLEIQVIGEPVRIVTEADLEDLPPRPGAGGRSHGGAGWHLRDVVALAARPERVDVVLALDEEAEAVRIEGDEFRDPADDPTLRLNRRRQLVLERFGALAMEGAARLRGVVRIEVTLREEDAVPPPRTVSGESVGDERADEEPRRLLDRERRQAIQALASAAPDPEARQALVDLLEDPDPKARDRAVHALLRWDDTTDVLYGRLSREDDPEVQCTLLRAIGDRGRVEHFEPLQRWMSSRDRAVSKAARKSVRRFARRLGEEVPEAARPGAGRR